MSARDNALALAPPPPAPTLVELISADGIVPVRIDWLWNGWLAKGRLQVLAGQPGTGKTTLAINIIATLTAGTPWPDGTRATAGDVVIWSGEDDPADTLVPRLIAAGADLKRVHFVKGVSEGESKRPFDPARDMAGLAQAVERVGTVKLVLIDPIAMVAVKDSHRNAETRRDLQPVLDLCQRTGAGALGIHHLAKGTAGREPLERLIGSIAFGAVARIALIASKLSPIGSERSERRAVVRAKSNIGPDGGGYVYSLPQCELRGHPGIFASRVLWGEAIEGTAVEILAEAESENEQGPRQEAKEFLQNLLSEGPVDSKEIYAAARTAMISSATLRRAKSDLKVKSAKNGFAADSAWTWGLPENPTTLPHESDGTQRSCSLPGESIFGTGEHLRVSELLNNRRNDTSEEVEF